MDTKNFFQEVTLRICSSLDLNKALCNLLEYLETILPINEISCVFVDQEESIFSLIASTNQEKIDYCEKNIEIMKSIPLEIDLKRWSSYANNAHELSIISNIESYYKFTKESKNIFFHLPVAILRMVIEGKASGSLVFSANQDFKFTNEHLDLLDTIHTPCALAVNNCLQFQKTLKLKQKLADENINLQKRMQAINNIEVIGATTGLKHIMNLVSHVAHLSTPVFIQGESGVGKEIIARAIHDLSPQKDMPFVVVNCGAVNANLLESEFFGHEKGAFTNAIKTHKGFFERAENGTIFLDEICELPLESQVKLLRVLQNYEIQRVGGSKNIQIDARIISASNKNIKQAVLDGLIREDLYYRLVVFPIEIPPLREHKEDIPILVDYFLRKKAAKMNRPVPRVSIETMQRLVKYDWHGNIRELENFLERALILSPIDQLHLPIEHEIGNKIELLFTNSDELLPLEDIIKKHISKTLVYTKGKISGKNGAAEILGMNRFTLYRKLEALKIDYKRSK